MRYLAIACLALLGPLRVQADQDSDPAPATAVAAEDEGAIKLGCGGNVDCARTYKAQLELAKGQEWNLKNYQEFVGRYRKVAKTPNGDTADVDGPIPFSISSADWDKRGLNFVSQRNKAGHNAWDYLYDDIKGEADQYAVARENAKIWFVKLQTERLKSSDFKRVINTKISNAFPGTRERQFKTKDVIFAYLGEEARDFLLQKAKYLDDLQNNRLGQDAALKAQHYLNRDQPMEHLPTGADLKSGSKVEKASDVKMLKGISNAWKNSQYDFDKTAVVSDAGSGAVHFKGGVLTPVQVKEPPKKNEPPPPAEDMSAVVAQLGTIGNQLSAQLGVVKDLKTKLAARQPQDEATQKASASLVEAESKLLAVQGKLAEAQKAPNKEEAAALAVEFQAAQAALTAAAEAAKPLLAEAPPSPDKPQCDWKTVTVPSVIACVGDGEGVHTSKPADRLYAPLTTALLNGWFVLKQENPPSEEGQKALAKIVAELKRRIAAEDPKNPHGWALHMPHMTEFRKENGAEFVSHEDTVEAPPAVEVAARAFDDAHHDNFIATDWDVRGGGHVTQWRTKDGDNVKAVTWTPANGQDGGSYIYVRGEGEILAGETSYTFPKDLIFDYKAGGEDGGTYRSLTGCALTKDHAVKGLEGIKSNADGHPPCFEKVNQ